MCNDVGEIRIDLDGYTTRLGKYLGFPDCCVQEFIKDSCTQTKLIFGELEPWWGTGYIPCPSCAFKIKQIGWEFFVQQVIQANRIHHDPFPIMSLSYKQLEKMFL